MNNKEVEKSGDDYESPIFRLSTEPMEIVEGPSRLGESPSSNKIREIRIEEVNYGFIVRVGCHTFAISTRVELTAKLIEYINEPAKTEEKWFEKKLF